MCKLNMALHLNWGIRPNVVFEQKRFGDKREREKLGQGEKIKIVGVISSHFLLLSD